MSGDVHVRFCERLGVQLPRATHLLLFASDSATLSSWHAAIVERIARLRLTLHPGAHPRPVREGFPFLGFIVFPGRRRLKRRKAIHYRRRLRWLMARYRAGIVSQSDVSASVRGWLNHARYGNTVGLRKAILRDAVLVGSRSFVTR